MLCRAMQCSVVQCSAHKTQAVSHSVTQTRAERLQRLYAFIHMKCTAAYCRLHPFSLSNPNKEIVTYRLVLLATYSTVQYSAVQYSAVQNFSIESDKCIKEWGFTNTLSDLIFFIKSKDGRPILIIAFSDDFRAFFIYSIID